MQVGQLREQLPHGRDLAVDAAQISARSQESAQGEGSTAGASLHTSPHKQRLGCRWHRRDKLSFTQPSKAPVSSDAMGKKKRRSKIAVQLLRRC